MRYILSTVEINASAHKNGGDELNRIIFQRLLSMLLVTILVIGMGFYSYSSGEPMDLEETIHPEIPDDPIDLEIPGELTDPEEPIDSETPGEPTDQEEPMDPETPSDPTNPNEPTDPEELIDPENPQNSEESIDHEEQILVYIIRYCLDGEEPDSWEVEGKVQKDNPIVEEVPHDKIPEGYIVDEHRSTKLPFEVSEENNVIEVYYIKETESEPKVTMPMGIPNPGYYVPSGAVGKTVVEGQSTNFHTKPALIWSNGETVYVAVKSTHTLKYMELGGSTSYDFDEYNPWVSIFVLDQNDDNADEDGYVEYKPEDLNGNTDDSHWTVFRFNLEELPIPESGKLIFFIKGQGGGHDVGGNIIVEVPKKDITGNKVWVGGDEGNRQVVTLQLKRKVGLGREETAKTGIVDGIVDENETSPWSYTWQDMPEYNPYGQPYIYFIDEEEVPMYYEKTLDGLTVTNTFIPQGEITITKYVENYDPVKDGGKVFDIFIYGPEGKIYTLSLQNGESGTITGLTNGRYAIEEVVPMNYELVEISFSVIDLTFEDNEAFATITNRRTDDGWFWDDPEPITNIFTVLGERDEDSSSPMGKPLYGKLDYFIIPYPLETENKFDNI